MTRSDLSATAPRRFYKTVEVGIQEPGFAVLLDGRVPKSPAGRPLVLPTRALAELCAAEWGAQEATINLAQMPATRLAWTTLDAISGRRDETRAEIVHYAGSDLLCYRADSPASFAHEQASAWDPLLDWARSELGLELEPVAGLLHRAQPPASLARLAELIASEDDFTLAGLAHATGLYGSAVLALAVWRGHLNGARAYELSRLEESWQERQWGIDPEAAQRTALHAAESDLAACWLAACSHQA